MSFIETRINDGEIVLETVGGPMYSTDIAVTRSGFEVRNINWAQSRHRFELGERMLNIAEKDAILRFFHAMRGRGYGFRAKDWADYKATHSTGVLGAGIGTGDATYQLGKKYTQGSATLIRTIQKPIATGFEVQRNGSAYGGVSLDAATGIVTVPAVSSFAISGITVANPGVVTATGHTFTNGQQIRISGVSGMTQVNGNKYTIAGVGTNVFNLGVSTVGFGTYTSGGTASRFPQTTDALTWAGEFDVPVRFDTDSLRNHFRAIRQDHGEMLFYLQSLELIEVRIR